MTRFFASHLLEVLHGQQVSETALQFASTQQPQPWPRIPEIGATEPGQLTLHCRGTHSGRPETARQGASAATGQRRWLESSQLQPPQHTAKGKETKETGGQDQREFTRLQPVPQRHFLRCSH